MSKKSRFRGPFDKWHGKRTKTLLKSERQHLYHTYWSLWTEFRWKKSLLVICKILRLLFNPLTVVEKCYVLNRGTLFQHFQLQLYKKRKIFSDFFLFFFFHFLNWDAFFNIFKEKWPSQVNYFWIYGLGKTWLEKCLKSLVSDDPSTRKTGNSVIHCWNLSGSTFTIFIDHSEGYSLWKIPF